MIESFHVSKDEVARWAGITSAAFSLSQAVTGIFWGRASDRYGRKPVILVGMVCTMLASILFGFSQSLAWAIVARSFAGAVNGNVGIMRTTVAELVPQRELQPRAFSVMPLVWTIGSILGPAFGGALANPALKYPRYFGRSSFFKKFPFALPNLASSSFFLVGLVAGFLFLKETLETRRTQRDYGRAFGQILLRPFSKTSKSVQWSQENEQSASLLGRSESSISIADRNKITREGKNIHQTPSRYSEVFSKESCINLLTYTLLALHGVAYDQLLPVFMHFPVQSSTDRNVRLPFKFAGGFGIDSNQIGFFFTLYGVCGMFVQFFVFPPVARRYGILRCMKIVTLIFPVLYMITPFTALMPTLFGKQATMFAIMIVKSFAVVFAFPCITILLTNSAVSHRILGTLNGVSTSISALGRAAGPAIGGWTFSLGVERGYVILPWWTLAAFAALGAVPVWWIIEMDSIGERQQRDHDAEEDSLEPGDDGILGRQSATQGTNTSGLYDIESDRLAPFEDPAGLTKVISRSSGRAPSPSRKRASTILKAGDRKVS